MFRTSKNGLTYEFYDDYLTVNNTRLNYIDMTDISHRSGDDPAFVFTYNNKRYSLPYNAEEYATILPYFQAAVSIVPTPDVPVIETPVQPRPMQTDDSTFVQTPTTIDQTPTTIDPDTGYNTAPAPVEYEQPPQPDPPVHMVQIAEKKKGFWSIGRLVIGIIALVLSMFILFQSCAAGIANTLEENGDVSGSTGFFLAILMIAGGIVGITTRNGKRKIGPIIAAVLFFLAALCGLTGIGTDFADLIVWSVVSACFGAVFLLCGIKTKAE